MNRTVTKTPFGLFHLLEKNDHLWIAGLDDCVEHFSPLFDSANEFETPVLCQAKRELTEYLAGQRRHFEVPLGLDLADWDMGTAFENRAWRTLVKIDYGRTISYKEQAMWMGNPKAIRAVGRANGKNPLCIFVPCHRVIGRQGALVGYGGGLEMKSHLLELEGHWTQPLLWKTDSSSPTVSE